MLVIETTPRTYYTDMSSLGRVITQVPVEDLEFIWSQVKPQIEKALDGSYSSYDILEYIKQNRMQLWISWNDGIEASFVTEVCDYPQLRVLRWVLAGGSNMESWLDLVTSKVEDWAKRNNCQRLEIVGRKGWTKVLRDYEPQAVYFVKELK
jgi:hypothetical protein